MLSVDMPIAFMLSSVIMLSIILLRVILLSARGANGRVSAVNRTPDGSTYPC
jgi:hypothetical protein